MTESSPAIRRRIFEIIAGEIQARPAQVEAAATLLDEGATVPFVARYRKEVTGGLDDAQLRTLEDRLTYLRELEARRATVIESIRSQGKLTEALENSLLEATTKADVEDLYLPYKPKRRTRAQIARERGLEPLLDELLADRRLDPEQTAARYPHEELADTKATLEGARDILAERLSEDARLLGQLRQHFRDHAVLSSKVFDGKEQAGAKFSDYFDHAEAWSKVAGHRALAMLRGRNEEFLLLNLDADADCADPIKPVERMVANSQNIPADGDKADRWLWEAACWSWRVKLKMGISIDLMLELRTRAEAEAIGVFSDNLKDLLLAAPAGAKAVLGLDPGIRTGVKVAAIDATGKLLETATIYPFQPRKDVRGSQETLARLVRSHQIELIAIGNGTASRETESLVSDLLAMLPSPKPTKLIVSEAGASVYSASALASAEFPDLDVSLRGAVSIARRLQDPLAELVKIEPKSIGVGQYQHDVDQNRLAKSLDAVVEDAVNAVGVDLNTASPALLSRVSGLSASLADAIVFRRNEQGAFNSRRELMDVPRVGAKTFEQCAGFLRIREGSEPLDASSVHPEAYDVARKIVADCGRDLRELIGDLGTLRKLDAKKFTDDKFGLPTVRDIIAELEKPSHDPRPEFRTASFAEGINEVSDLKPGMSLEGTVTNVAAFGAFVDIGVHQDGLVHISQLADSFVKDPRKVVRAGQIVKVRVVDIDLQRKRIALTMRSRAAEQGSGVAQSKNKNGNAPQRPNKPVKSNKRPAPSPSLQGNLGSALADAMRGGNGNKT